MGVAGPLVLDVAGLLRRPGQRRHESLDVELDGLAVSGGQVPEGALVHLEVRLEALNEGLVVRGWAGFPWNGACRRCLRVVAGDVRSPIMEVFERAPVDGETFGLHGGVVDLEPVVREAVLLELPMAPLCTEDCAGLCPSCGADRNEEGCGCAEQDRDPRWDALDAFEE